MPCWTKETVDNSVDTQESVWPERYATDDLRKEKRAAIAINKLSVFSREMELRLVSPELAAFRSEWLKYHTEMGVVPGCANVLAIDPTPPPSDAQVAKGMMGSDFEAIQVWGRRGDNYYLQERRAKPRRDAGLDDRQRVRDGAPLPCNVYCCRECGVPAYAQMAAREGNGAAAYLLLSCPLCWRKQVRAYP